MPIRFWCEHNISAIACGRLPATYVLQCDIPLVLVSLGAQLAKIDFIVNGGRVK